MLLLLRQQRIQLVDELVEQLQRLVDGSRGGQIHTGQLQQVDGRHGAAAGQELEVVVHSRLAFLQDTAADGDGSGVAGGVLVDIVVVVEVKMCIRDSPYTLYKVCQITLTVVFTLLPVPAVQVMVA